MKYPYSQPFLTEEDAINVREVLTSQFLTGGVFVEQLEAEFESIFSVKHAVVVNSGTAALHMAYDGLGLGPGRGLITTPITFLATANAAKMCGAPVNFADVDPKTGNVTLLNIINAVETADFEVGVIAIVHLGGLPCEDIEEISLYARSIGASLVEDACHAPLAKYCNGIGKKFLVGSCAHSDAATLSLHAIKHVTAGEGGVLLTNRDDLAEKARRFRSHGMVRDSAKMLHVEEAGAPWYYEMHSLGFNYRIPELSCALAINQTKRLVKNLERRQQIASVYHESLECVENLILPPIDYENGSVHSWHLFAPRFDFKNIGKTRAQIMNALNECEIGTQVHYIPLYRQPYYSNAGPSAKLLGAEQYYEKTLSLPMYLGLTDDDVRYISQKLKKILGQ